MPWRVATRLRSEALQLLSDDALAVLRAILAAPQAWVPLAGLDATAVDALIGHAPPLVEVWRRPDQAMAALTPWALWACRAKVAEQRIVTTEVLREWAGPDRLPIRRVVQVYDDQPRYADQEQAERPIRVPRHMREVELRHPELVIDHRHGPAEVVTDEVTGEPVKILGQVVVRDPRIKPASPQRVTRMASRRGQGVRPLSNA